MLKLILLFSFSFDPLPAIRSVSAVSVDGGMRSISKNPRLMQKPDKSIGPAPFIAVNKRVVLYYKIKKICGFFLNRRVNFFLPKDCITLPIIASTPSLFLSTANSASSFFSFIQNALNASSAAANSLTVNFTGFFVSPSVASVSLS